MKTHCLDKLKNYLPGIDSESILETITHKKEINMKRLREVAETRILADTDNNNNNNNSNNNNNNNSNNNIIDTNTYNRGYTLNLRRTNVEKRNALTPIRTINILKLKNYGG
jgi:hypothetical protein